MFLERNTTRHFGLVKTSKFLREKVTFAGAEGTKQTENCKAIHGSFPEHGLRTFSRLCLAIYYARESRVITRCDAVKTYRRPRRRCRRPRGGVGALVRRCRRRRPRRPAAGGGAVARPPRCPRPPGS